MPPAAEPSPAPVVALLERVALATPAATTLVVALLVAKNHLEPVQVPTSIGLALWRLFVVLHAALAMAIAAILLVVRLRWPRAAAALARVAALAVVVLAWAGNPGTARWWAGLGSDRFARLLLAAWIAAQVALVLAAALPLARRWPQRLASFVAAGLFVAALWPQPPAAPAAAAVPVQAATGAGSPATAPPLLVYGIDGADWKFVEPLIARGRMPNLARLRERGVWGPLESMVPTNSPIIWTTVATGQHPRRHGIRNFTVRRVSGVLSPLPRLKPLRLLGYDTAMQLLEEKGFVFEAPVSNLARREPAVWNLLTQAGRHVTVVNWWATWPAERVSGRIVTDRIHYWRSAERGWRAEFEQLTWPPDLYARLGPAIVSPDAVTAARAREFVDVDEPGWERMKATPFSKHMLESELRYFISMHDSNRALARQLVALDEADPGHPSDMLVLERIVDQACHAALAESDLVDEHIDAGPERQRQFGNVVGAAYEAADRALGDLLRTYGPDTNVVVLSDHGFKLSFIWPDWHRAYDHKEGPPGIFVAAGPAFGRGRVDGVGVYDMLPLMVHLTGLPLAADLPGKIPAQALGEEARGRTPARVATYGTGGRVVPQADSDGGNDEESMERLRALGYIR